MDGKGPNKQALFWIVSTPLGLPYSEMKCFNGRMIPTPIEGKPGGGAKPTCRIPLFFAWKPWDSDPIAQMEF